MTTSRQGAAWLALAVAALIAHRKQARALRDAAVRLSRLEDRALSAGPLSDFALPSWWDRPTAAAKFRFERP